MYIHESEVRHDVSERCEPFCARFDTVEAEHRRLGGLDYQNPDLVFIVTR